MPYELCRHIKTNGRRCKSPCITGEFWCFFHTRVHFRHRSIGKSKPVATPTPLYLPVIEDRESVQVAISLIVGAVASGHLEEKRAGTLLRALSLATRNVGKFGEITTAWLSSDSAQNFISTLDGFDIGPRQMSDDSKPPARDPFSQREPDPIKPAPRSAIS